MQDEKIERLKQELETTATDDDNDSGGEQGIVMKCGHSYIQLKIPTSRSLAIFHCSIFPPSIDKKTFIEKEAW